jgi:hypothetical protein
MIGVHHDEPARREALVLDLDAIGCEGARRMLAQALGAELETYLRVARDEREGRGRALVVRVTLMPGGGARGHRGRGSPRVNDKRVNDKTPAWRDPADVRAPLAEPQ